MPPFAKHSIKWNTMIFYNNCTYRFYFVVILLCCSVSGFSQIIEAEIDSLLKLLPNQEGTEKLITYTMIGSRYQNTYNENVVEFSKEGYKFFQTLDNLEEKYWHKAHFLIAFQAGYHQRYGNYGEVLKNCDQLKEHGRQMEALGFKSAAEMKCSAELYRAKVYIKQNKVEQALKTALKGVSYFENPDTIPAAIPGLLFIGSRYGQLKKFANSNRYFEKAIRYFKKIYENDPGDNKHHTMGNKIRITACYYNRGEMYVENELWERAIPDLENAIKYSEGLKHPLRTRCLISLSNVYSEVDRNQEAYQYLKALEPEMEHITDPMTQHYFYETFAKVAANLKRFEEAYDYLENYSIIQDSVTVNAYDTEIAALQTKYETKEKENEIVQLQASNQSRTNQNRLLWLLVGGLSLLAGFIYFQNRQKKKFADQILKKDKEVLELKENFFINITHQLRTPLSLIIAPLKEVQNSNIDAKNKLKIDQALKNSGRLLELFNQLLDWNKMEAHALKLTMKKADIIESLRSIFMRYEELANQKQITFTHNLTDTPVYGEMDFDKFEKVLGNLISNAIKFTPVGGKVSVRSKLSKGKLQIEVEDNGVGIKEADIDRVFEKYYQAGDGSDGFGFGLTFANELTKLMGGNLSAQSTSNVKTVFELAIPFTELSKLPEVAQRAQKVAMPNPIFSETSMSLLIIEDNIELNNYLSSFFESQYTILSALNKKEALDLAYAHSPDIILCDVMLPDGNGFQILEELKNNASTSHIPILMLTAKTDEKDRKEGWDKGADGYLNKPFDPDELNTVIYNLLLNRKKVQEKFSALTEEFLADKTPEVQDPFMENLLTLMNDNIGNEYYSIDDLAANFPMNRTHFYQKVKALSGSTPKTLFRELRLKKANRLIRSGITPKEAALKTGFVSLSHFSRSYKSFFKENPSETSRT